MKRTTTPAILGGRAAISNFTLEKWPTITRKESESIARYLRSEPWSINGKSGVILELEEAYKAYFDVRFALCTSSGTGALHSAYFALQLKPGDEVLVPNYTYFATVLPLLQMKAVPVMVDSDPLTGNMSPHALKAHLTSRTTAIVVTHMSGMPADIQAILDFARAHGLRVVEDASQAHGARAGGKLVGTFGDVGVFSMQAKKIVPAGEGGMLLTNDLSIYELAVLFGHPQARALGGVSSLPLAEYASTGFGLKYRIHPLAAKLGLISFGKLETVLASRQENCGYLSEGLSRISSIATPWVGPHVSRVAWYSYQPMHLHGASGMSRELYVKALQSEGLPIETPQSPPLNRESLFRDASALKEYLFYGELSERVAEANSAREYRGSETYFQGALRLPVCTKPSSRLMDAFVRCFEKVEEHKDKIVRSFAELGKEQA